MTWAMIFKVIRKIHASGNSYRMNSLTQKPYETNKNHCGSTNTGRNDICHVDHDVTFSFKVMREGHANGDSWNEFPDLKSLRNNKKNHRGRTNTSRDNRSYVDHDVTFSSRSGVNACVKDTQSAIVRMYLSTWLPCETEVKSSLQFTHSDI